MTTVVPPPPPPPPPPVPAAATPAPQPTLTVANPPPPAMRLAIGAIFDGTVTAAPDKGTLQLQTPAGILTAEPPAALPAAALPQGSALVLQVLSVSPRFQLQINFIDAKPPLPNIAAGVAGAAGKATGKAAAGIRGELPALAAGTRLTATLMTPARTTDTAAAPEAGKAEAKGAGGLIGKAAGALGNGLWALTGIRGAKAAAAKAAKTPSTLLSPVRSAARSISRATAQYAFQAAAKSGAPPVAGAGGASNANVLPAGTQVPVRVVMVEPALTAGRRPTPAGGLLILNRGGRVTGTVAGATMSGNPVFRAPGGDMALGVRAVPAEGSSVTLEVIGRPKIPSQDVLRPNPTGGNEIIDTGRWPALGETLTLLAATNPPAARHLAAQVIPRLDSSLTSGMLFFISALRGGNVRGWLGEGVERTLQRHRPGLLGRLGDDFRAISRTADDPQGGEWRSVPIPLLGGESLEQIRLHIRRHGDDDETGDDKAQSRFIVDLSLSRMGRMQLDGLVRGGESKRLDLIVRSPSPLTPAMREDIRRIFSAAGEATGIKGGVTFQATPANFVDVGRTGDGAENEGLTV